MEVRRSPVHRTGAINLSSSPGRRCGLCSARASRLWRALKGAKRSRFVVLINNSLVARIDDTALKPSVSTHVERSLWPEPHVPGMPGAADATTVPSRHVETDAQFGT